MFVDINVDLGEGFGIYKVANDDEFMSHISSANIACGFHAGDPVIMENTVKLAIEHNVSIGAHPGFNDKQGFGRREIVMSEKELYCDLIYQIGALKAFIEKNGGKLHHIKPHGKLYGMAHTNNDIAKVICQVILDLDKNIFLYCMKNGVLANIANSLGIKTIFELYADLDYDKHGNLIITKEHSEKDPSEASKRVIRMLTEKKVTSIEGADIVIEGTSICIHSDTPNSLSLLKFLKNKLVSEKYIIKAP
ncbi:MAG: 5-oxoprolinase subunit PxpA [Candidatus Micrarchaeaceae archaeon]